MRQLAAPIVYVCGFWGGTQLIANFNENCISSPTTWKYFMSLEGSYQRDHISDLFWQISEGWVSMLGCIQGKGEWTLPTGRIVEVSFQDVGGTEAIRMKGWVLPGKARKAELDHGEHLATIKIWIFILKTSIRTHIYWALCQAVYWEQLILSSL